MSLGRPDKFILSEHIVRSLIGSLRQSWVFDHTTKSLKSPPPHPKWINWSIDHPTMIYRMDKLFLDQVILFVGQKTLFFSTETLLIITILKNHYSYCFIQSVVLCVIIDNLFKKYYRLQLLVGKSWYVNSPTSWEYLQIF